MLPANRQMANAFQDRMRANSRPARVSLAYHKVNRGFIAARPFPMRDLVGSFRLPATASHEELCKSDTDAYHKCVAAGFNGLFAQFGVELRPLQLEGYMSKAYRKARRWVALAYPVAVPWMALTGTQSVPSFN
jgi:hypothetical protein